MARIVRCDLCGNEAPFSRKSGAPKPWEVVESKDVCSSACAIEFRERERRKLETVDGRALRLTDHALARFTERAVYVGLETRDPVVTLRRLVKSARPEELDSIRKTKRLLSNGCTQADYYASGVWRFVVVGTELVTVETRNHHN